MQPSDIKLLEKKNKAFIFFTPLQLAFQMIFFYWSIHKKSYIYTI